jgi:hypothetical protein
VALTISPVRVHPVNVEARSRRAKR